MSHLLSDHSRQRLAALVARRFPLTCTIIPPGQRTAAGTVTTQKPYTSPCRYSEENKRVKKDDGTYSVITTQVFEVPMTTVIDAGYGVRIGTGDLFAVTSVATPTLDGLFLRKVCALEGARG
jgi:hypothetical protein